MTHAASPGATTVAPHGEARFAGLMYAINVATGVFSLAVAPGLIFAGETDAEIVRSIAANETLLRLLIAAQIICYIAFLLVALALYKLLARAGQFAAMLMASLAIVSVPAGFVYITHLFEILRAVDSGAPEAAQAVRSALDRYWSGLLMQSIPWGLWLFPFGYLVIRSGFLPRILGLLLMLGGVGYLADFLGRLLLPDVYRASGLDPIFSALHLSEIVMCLWLLIFGARRTLLPARSRP